MNKSDLVYYLENRIKDCQNQMSLINQRMQVYRELLTDIESQKDW